ncbi:MAG: hypothetical protein ABJD97_05695 [Betaproteobacteria bacterium]
MLARIKNNRIAAVVILAALGIGGVASLTDSARKLGDALPSFASQSVAGEWKSDEAAFYRFFGQEAVRLYLQQPTADQVIGIIQFGGSALSEPRGFQIVDGKRAGKTLTLSFDGSSGHRETLVGDLTSNELHLVHHFEGAAAVPITARRIAQSTQLVDGRFGIVYKRMQYPDPRAACVQLLKDLDPPQSYALSDKPDESGNVHCVGKQADGSKGFDQFENEVRQQLICPARSRFTLIGGQVSPTSTKGCECDGDLQASRSGCVPR